MICAGQGRAWGQKQSTQGVGMGGGVRLRYVWKKIKIWTEWWLLLHFLNLNTDLIVSKTKVKNSQNPIALVQDYYKIGILVILRPNPGEACFYRIFRDFRRFYFLDIQKLKYAAAYFKYTQARSCRCSLLFSENK